MKQPELGKRIADLRQSQGLTQEELVEKCNINVRTIQRIEAGEVTPRSYTVRSIFEALGASANELLAVPKAEGVSIDRNIILYALISAIIYLFIGLPEGLLDYVRFSGEAIGSDYLDVNLTAFGSDLFYVIIKVFAVISYAGLMFGFYHVADKYALMLLKAGASILILLTLLFGVFDILSLWIPSLNFADAGVLVVYIIVFGVAGAVFGVGMLSFRKTAGDLALVIGIIELVMAFCLFTFVLSFFALMLTLPAVLLEAIILYQLYNKTDYSADEPVSREATANT